MQFIISNVLSNHREYLVHSTFFPLCLLARHVAFSFKRGKNLRHRWIYTLALGYNTTLYRRSVLSPWDRFKSGRPPSHTCAPTASSEAKSQREWATDIVFRSTEPDRKGVLMRSLLTEMSSGEPPFWAVWWLPQNVTMRAAAPCLFPVLSHCCVTCISLPCSPLLQSPHSFPRPASLLDLTCLPIANSAISQGKVGLCPRGALNRSVWDQNRLSHGCHVINEGLDS